MARYSLTDNEFEAIESLIRYKPARGTEPTQIREMFDGILWVLCSGAPWRDLPNHYPPYQSVYHRFRYYQKHGILEQVIETLLEKASKNRRVQLTLVCIDGSYIRAHRHAAGAPKKRRSKRRRIAICRRFGLVPVIPKRLDKQGKRQRNPGFEKKKYKKRNIVELTGVPKQLEQ